MLREEGHFSGYDELELFWQAWHCADESKIKANIIVTHGHGEHSECYSNLVEGILDDGFQVYAWDLRGHGRSEGKRGVVSSFDEYIRDLKLFIEFVRPKFKDKPFFLLGHSTGALVLLKYLIRNGMGWANAAIVSSPLISVALEIPTWKKKFANLVGNAAPNFTLSSGLTHEQLTSDKKLLRGYYADVYRHDRISPTLYLAMLDNGQYVLQRADKIPGPILFQVSNKDTVVSQPLALKLYESIPEAIDKTLYQYDLLHEIYNDAGREKPFADLKSWLNRQLEKKK